MLEPKQQQEDEVTNSSEDDLEKQEQEPQPTKNFPTMRSLLLSSLCLASVFLLAVLPPTIMAMEGSMGGKRNGGKKGSIVDTPACPTNRGEAIAAANKNLLDAWYDVLFTTKCDADAVEAVYRNQFSTDFVLTTTQGAQIDLDTFFVAFIGTNEQPGPQLQRCLDGVATSWVGEGVENLTKDGFVWKGRRFDVLGDGSELENEVEYFFDTTDCGDIKISAVNLVTENNPN